MLKLDSKGQLTTLLFTALTYVTNLSAVLDIPAGGLRTIRYLSVFFTHIVVESWNHKLLLLLALIGILNTTSFADQWVAGGYNLPDFPSGCTGMCISDDPTLAHLSHLYSEVALVSPHIFRAEYPTAPLLILKAFYNGSLKVYSLSGNDGYLRIDPPRNLSSIYPVLTAKIGVYSNLRDTIYDLTNHGTPVAIVVPSDIYSRAATLYIGNTTINETLLCPTRKTYGEGIWKSLETKFNATGELHIGYSKKFKVKKNNNTYIIQYGSITTDASSILYNGTWYLGDKAVKIIDKPYLLEVSCESTGTITVKAERHPILNGDGEIRPFPIGIRPYKTRSFFGFYTNSIFVVYPTYVEKLEGFNVEISAKSGVLEVADGIIVAKPLDNVKMFANRVQVVGGGGTYVTIKGENVIINNTVIGTAYVLLRYPNMTFRNAEIQIGGKLYYGKNVECNLAIYDHGLYCYDILNTNLKPYIPNEFI
ncbi:MAG: hypothetical protein ACPL07_02725, partial [Candidatus Bathyarchaeia archaeon]